MAVLICQSCQAVWESTELSIDVVFLRFDTNPALHEQQENTLQEIFDAGAEITSCPKCPIEDSTSPDQPRSAGGTTTGLNEDMHKGSNRRTAGDEDQSPPPATGGVTHGA